MIDEIKSKIIHCLYGPSSRNGNRSTLRRIWPIAQCKFANIFNNILPLKNLSLNIVKYTDVIPLYYRLYLPQRTIFSEFCDFPKDVLLAWLGVVQAALKIRKESPDHGYMPENTELHRHAGDHQQRTEACKNKEKMVVKDAAILQRSEDQPADENEEHRVKNQVDGRRKQKSQARIALCPSSDESQQHNDEKDHDREV